MKAMILLLLGGILCVPVANADGAAKANYMIHCQGCHLPAGDGIPPAVPSLVEDMAKFLRMEGGRAYLVQVPGTSYSSLNNAQVAALLNWMLQTYASSSLPGDFRPYTTEEVTRYRAERLVNPAARRDELLAALAH